MISFSDSVLENHMRFCKKLNDKYRNLEENNTIKISYIDYTYQKGVYEQSYQTGTLEGTIGNVVPGQGIYLYVLETGSSVFCPFLSENEAITKIELKTKDRNYGPICKTIYELYGFNKNDSYIKRKSLFNPEKKLDILVDISNNLIGRTYTKEFRKRLLAEQAEMRNDLNLDFQFGNRSALNKRLRPSESCKNENFRHNSLREL